MSNRLNATYGVANLDTLLKLGEASVPRRIANEIYFIRASTSDASLFKGRWAQYLPDSVLTVDESTVWYPRDSGGSDITNQGRWLLFPVGESGGGSGGELTDGDKGDITVSNSGAVWTIDNGAVTASKLASTAVSAGSYTSANITVDAQGRLTAAANGSGGSGVSDGDKGDITVSSSGATWTIDNGVVSTAKIADDAITADKLANTAVTPGSYTNTDLTVDAQGRITAASNGAGGGTAGAIPASATAPTGANPTINPATGEANIILQTGTPPKLWIGVGATQWASVDLTVFSGGGGGDHTFIDTDAETYYERLSGTYSEPEQAAIDAFFIAIKGRTISDGGSQWASLTEFWICSLDNSTDALLGLKGNFALQTQNSPTFTARQGFKLNGTTQFLSSAINPSLRSAVSRGIIGAYTRLGSTDYNLILQADFNTFIEHGGNGNEVFGSILGGTVATTIAGEYKGALSMVAKSDAFLDGEVFLVFNQSTFTSFAAGNAPPNVASITWGDGSDDQFAVCWVGFEGKGWTTAETQAFHADVETLLDAFGAGVIP